MSKIYLSPFGIPPGSYTSRGKEAADRERLQLSQSAVISQWLWSRTCCQKVVGGRAVVPELVLAVAGGVAMRVESGNFGVAWR
ncbi:hypothetical protein TNCT_604371 [Trichonephila clavata]|uniref:Uncharacterized protein n=1 Tax=Trichonephila clavata TaxID=2740835 RepID=A0A8X6KZQ6_TRICU|nr:hypothetical protein TNCT_604371 [Trichonephila clavata]